MSAHIPLAVLTEALRTQINKRRVLAAVFCTFRFEPDFFEQEILPVLFDLPLHQVPLVRRLQLEDALRPLAGRVAVYYDPRALAVGNGSASLDVRRIPVRPTTGYFHPKNAFVLIEDESTQERALVVLTASANLTQAGWWENLECFHIEEIAEGGRSRTAPDIQRFLRHLRTLAKHFGPQEPLEDIHSFLKTVQPIAHHTANSIVHPHFVFNGGRGTDALVDQLHEIAGRWLRGADMEVISPYLDDADASTPLRELIEHFQPRTWRVLLPEDRGMAQCRPALYDWVREHGGEWGRLPKTVTGHGGKQAAGASPRSVHAKVYRFLGKNYAITLVGSFNLTRPAHQARGNVEAGVLVEEPVKRPPRFWLEPVEDPPPFAQTVSEDEGVEQGFVPLLVRFDWATGRAEVLWDGPTQSPRLELYDQGVCIIDIGHLEPATWTALPTNDSEVLRERLRSTSFFTVRAGDQVGTILVHEIGMAHRPSLLLDLGPAEILRYWSLLNAEQRAAFLAERGEALRGLAGAEELVVPALGVKPLEAIFDRFAGMFHGFGSLTRAVVAALEEGRVEEARFLTFGAKYDSLPVLVERVANDSDDDPVDRYLMVLCAQQLADRVRLKYPDFWASDPAGSARLEAALAVRPALRTQIIAGNDPEMAEFVDWYEPRFLREAAEVPA